jgi:hypothetical protein
MQHGRRRRDLRRRIAEFEIPRPFTIDALCARIAADRGRPLRLLPLPQLSGPGQPCGMWIATEKFDYIFHARGTSPLHQQNIVLHEIGHMLCEHTGLGAGAASLLPLLDPAMVQRILARSRYSTPQEEEAELAAALILETAGWPTAGPRPLGDLDDLF